MSALPNDHVSSGTVLDFLRSSLPDYTSTDLDPQSRPKYGASQSTSKWVKTGMINELIITSNQWNWQSESTFGILEAKLKDLKWEEFEEGDQVKYERKLPFRWPITEGDNVVAVESRLVQPVWYIMNHLIEGRGMPQHTKAKDLNFTTYVYNESYSSGDNGLTRVDKIFVYSFDALKYEEVRQSMIQTRARSAYSSAATPEKKKITLSYLPFGGVWAYLAPGKDCTNDMEKFKGLVPVEVKKLGILTLQNFKALFDTPEDGSVNLSQTPSEPPLKLLTGVLQQSVRYVILYGCRYGYLTDSVNSVILKLPADPSEGELNLSGTLEWAFIPNDGKPRLALAYLVYLAKLEVDVAFLEQEKLFSKVRVTVDKVATKLAETTLSDKTARRG